VYFSNNLTFQLIGLFRWLARLRGISNIFIFNFYRSLVRIKASFNCLCVD
jgi:hypothetical protein